MDLRIVTLDRPRPLTREEQRHQKKLRQVQLLGCVAGICIGLILGIIVGNSAAGFAFGKIPPSPEPQQMTNKLDIPAIATVSLLDVVKIAHPEQMGEPSPIWDVPLTDEEMTALLETCEAGQIHPSIGLGLIQVESSVRPDALNTASGCYGYCQLNPKYFPSDLAPADNIRTGMEYLAYQLERYDGDLEAALTAYNAGHDTGDRTYADMVITAAATFRG